MIPWPTTTWRTSGPRLPSKAYFGVMDNVSDEHRWKVASSTTAPRRSALSGVMASL